MFCNDFAQLLNVDLEARRNDFLQSTDHRGDPSSF